MIENAAAFVEAEVIDGRNDGLTVAYSAGSVSANFDALEARVDAILAQYDGWEPSADDASDVRQCASERKYLNGLAKQLDERRKAVKQEYVRPLAEFEARANELRDRLKAGAARLKAVEDEADAARRDAKEAELRGHYECYAGLLADAAPYAALADPRWLNKSVPMAKAKAELEAKADRVARDWEALKGMDLAFPESAEAAFFATLDLGAAVQTDARLKADRERIGAVKSALAPKAEPERRFPTVIACDAIGRSQISQAARFLESLDPPVSATFMAGTLADVAKAVVNQEGKEAEDGR